MPPLFVLQQLRKEKRIWQENYIMVVSKCNFIKKKREKYEEK